MVTALACGSVRTMFDQIAADHSSDSLSSQLAMLNGILDKMLSDNEGRIGAMMSMIILGMDLNTGKCALINSGHVHPFMLNGEECNPMPVRGNPLGLGMAGMNKVYEFNL